MGEREGVLPPRREPSVPRAPGRTKWLLSPGRRPVWGRAAGRVWERGGCSGDRRRVEPAGLSEPPYLGRPRGKGGRGEPVLLRRSREKRSRGRCVRRTGTRWGDDGGAAANAPTLRGRRPLLRTLWHRVLRSPEPPRSLPTLHRRGNRGPGERTRCPRVCEWQRPGWSPGTPARVPGAGTGFRSR